MNREWCGGGWVGRGQLRICTHVIDLLFHSHALKNVYLPRFADSKTTKPILLDSLHREILRYTLIQLYSLCPLNIYLQILKRPSRYCLIHFTEEFAWFSQHLPTDSKTTKPILLDLLHREIRLVLLTFAYRF